MIRLTRRYRFCASHRLHTPAMSDTENRTLYGKCNNPYGHGHNYVLEVSVADVAAAPEGVLVPVNALDSLVHRQVIEKLDHRSLNHEIPAFRAPGGTVPTTENLAREIRRMLAEHWPEAFPSIGPRLDRIRLEETDNNFFELRT
jgi:6-pyruvoyltetrahydropterin/6-carboxytetrahydropterin synthase